jgi:hypothetical protein
MTRLPRTGNSAFYGRDTPCYRRNVVAREDAVSGTHVGGLVKVNMITPAHHR